MPVLYHKIAETRTYMCGISLISFHVPNDTSVLSKAQIEQGSIKMTSLRWLSFDTDWIRLICLSIGDIDLYYNLGTFYHRDDDDDDYSYMYSLFSRLGHIYSLAHGFFLSFYEASHSFLASANLLRWKLKVEFGLLRLRCVVIHLSFTFFFVS